MYSYSIIIHDSNTTINVSRETVTRIKAGDTFSIIAKKYGTTPTAIESTNPGANPNDLQIGQVINLPSNGTADAQDSVTSVTAAYGLLSTSYLMSVSSRLLNGEVNGAITISGASTTLDPDFQSEPAASTNPTALNSDPSTSDQDIASSTSELPSVYTKSDESGVMPAASASVTQFSAASDTISSNIALGPISSDAVVSSNNQPTILFTPFTQSASMDSSSASASSNVPRLLAPQNRK